MNSTRHQLLVTIGLFLLVTAYLWIGFDAHLLPMDEGLLLAYPEQMLNGKLPYRDFETFYPPGNLLVLLATYQIFDFSFIAERAVGLFYRLAILAAIFLIVKRWSFVLAVGATVIATLIIKLTQIVAFAWWGGVACALWSIVFLTLVNLRSRVAVAGLLGGAALLFRQDLGPAVILASLPYWLSMTGRQRVFYLASFAVALLPLVWITVIAGIKPVFDNLFFYPVLICNTARRLPISLDKMELVILLGFHFLAVIVNLLVSVILMREKGANPNAKLLLSVSLLGLAVTPQALQRFDTIHLAFAMFCSVPIFPCTICILLARVVNWRPSPRREGIVFATILCVLVGIGTMKPSLRGIYSVSAEISSVPLEVKDRKVPLGSAAEFRTINRIASLMQMFSRPGERLFVGPRDLRRTVASEVYFYHLFSWLEPASYFLELNPLSANREGSRLASDIASADWLVLNRFYDNWNEPNASGHFGPDAPNQIVKSQFLVRAEIDTFIVLERANRSAANAQKPPLPDGSAAP